MRPLVPALSSPQGVNKRLEIEKEKLFTSIQKVDKFAEKISKTIYQLNYFEASLLDRIKMTKNWLEFDQKKIDNDEP